MTTPKKRGRQPRKDDQIKITGSGRFQPPDSFEWFPFKKGTHLPPGSKIKYPSKGPGGNVGKTSSPGGSLVVTSRKPKSKTKKKKRPPKKTKY